MPTSERYDAFVSYSHAVDSQLAPALQLALHRMAKPWYRIRALRVFLDESSLSNTPALWPSIQRALDGSRHFILLAAPSAAASPWVQKETAYWVAKRPKENVVIALTEGHVAWNPVDGDFNWIQTTAVPQTLSGVFDHEPRWTDFRWARDTDDVSLRHPRFRECVTDIAATVHGRPKDELLGEDVRQHRRTVRLARAAVSVLVGLLVAAAVRSITAGPWTSSRSATWPSRIWVISTTLFTAGSVRTSLRQPTRGGVVLGHAGYSDNAAIGPQGRRCQDRGRQL